MMLDGCCSCYVMLAVSQRTVAVKCTLPLGYVSHTDWPCGATVCDELAVVIEECCLTRTADPSRRFLLKDSTCTYVLL